MSNKFLSVLGACGRVVLGAFFQRLLFITECIVSIVLLVATFHFAYMIAQANPDIGCALTSAFRDVACSNAKNLMPPMTEGCNMYASVRDSLCPPQFRASWYL